MKRPQPTQLQYLTGDATQPVGGGHKLIIHVCNDVGAWGRGFTTSLNYRWPVVEMAFRAWHLGSTDLERLKAFMTGSFKLGAVQFVDVNDAITIANMVAQHGLGRANEPIRYDALRECLGHVEEYCWDGKQTIHAPKFGAGLAGGDWDRIRKITEVALCERGIPVAIYERA